MLIQSMCFQLSEEHRQNLEQVWMDIPLLESLIIIKNKMKSRTECCYSVKFTDVFLARAKLLLRLLAGKDNDSSCSIIPDDMEESRALS